MLDKNIGFILEKIEASDRWHVIVSCGIKRWIRTPRDINRFSNSLKFTWPALEDEVDPADILAIEGVRLFEPKIFEWIRSNRSFLFPDGFGYVNEEESENRRKELHQLIIDNSDKSVIRLLTCLFPSRTKQITGGEREGEEAHYQVVRRRGIGVISAFNTYMAFGLSEGILPSSAVRTIINSLENEEELNKSFETWLGRNDTRGQPVIGELFNEIQYRMMEPNAIKPTQHLLNALFSSGEAVSRLKVKAGLLQLNPYQILHLLISDILKTYAAGEASKALVDALQSKRNVAYGIETMVIYGIMLGEIGVSEDNMKSPISKLDWEVFRNVIKPLFDEDLQSGQYLKYPGVWLTIRAYAYFRGYEDCKGWVIESAKRDIRFMLGAAVNLLNEYSSTKGTFFRLKEEPDESIYDLEALLPIAQAAVKKGVFSTEEQEQMAAFIEGTISRLESR